MQLFVLALVFGIFAHDATMAAMVLPAEAGWRMAALVLLPKIAIGLAFGGACLATSRRLSTNDGPAALRWLDRLSVLFRFSALLLYGFDLKMGALQYIRQQMGDWILIDELMIITPTLLLIGWAWWCYYPVDRRLREAALMRRMDQGLPVHPIWTRRQYLLSQFRHQIALLFVPLSILMAWFEIVPADLTPILGYNPQEAVLLTGAGCVFLFTPVMMRYIWHTEALPAGDIRDRLTRLCKQHRVRVRELLLWHTFGGMLNAAVMGFIAPFRYILMTDALLEMVPATQVEAVMAHEVAHVRRHHMFWLAAVAMTLLSILPLLWHTLLTYSAAWLTSAFDPLYVQGAVWIGTAFCWLGAFGWVSRRFERQADTFAVQHLSRQSDSDRAAAGPVDAEAVNTMTAALQAVAEMNHSSPNRKSWRHGSILWRQNYLRSLVGQPINQLGIDRQVFWIKMAAGVSLAMLIGASVLLEKVAAMFIVTP